MAYFIRLTLSFSLLMCTLGCGGDREFTFSTPGLALEQGQEAQAAFARLQAHGPISGQDLVDYANLAAGRAKMAVIAQTIVDFAFVQDPALQQDLEPIQLEIEALKQAPKSNNSQIGYVDD